MRGSRDMKNVQVIEPANVPTQAAPESPLTWEGHMCDDVGATGGVKPLAALSATRNELVVSGTRGTHRIPASAVTRIGRGGVYPWLFRAIRIHHNQPGCPDLQFKPTAAKVPEVLAALERLGYRVR